MMTGSIFVDHIRARYARSSMIDFALMVTDAFSNGSQRQAEQLAMDSELTDSGRFSEMFASGNTHEEVTPGCFCRPYGPVMFNTSNGFRLPDGEAGHR
jgi:hypothetical protein